MKTNRLCKGLLAAVTLLLACVGNASAWGHGGHIHSRVYFGVGVGPGYWGPSYWGPSYYYPRPAYYPPYAPVIINQTPPVYVEQTPTVAPVVAPVAPAAPAVSSNNYWYYCAASRAYYPYVKTCPAGWMKVLPQTPQ